MADCRQMNVKYQAARDAGNTAGAAEYLKYMCSEGCQNLIYGLPCPSTPPPPAPATPPPDQSCQNFLISYNAAVGRGDLTDQTVTVTAMCQNQCPIPIGWSCSNGTAVAPQPVKPVKPPTPVPSPEPAPDNCTQLLVSYNALSQHHFGNITPATILQQMCAANCTNLPVGQSCPKPSSSDPCPGILDQYNAAVAAADQTAISAALRDMCLWQCKLPAGYVCDNEGAGPATTTPGIGGGNTPSGGGVIEQGPPVNPCTGENSLTLVDYLINMPLKGVQDDPLLAIGISVAGGVSAAVVVAVFIPEGGKWVRIPAAIGGAYGGLVINGILDNYDFIQNAEKYGIVFGSLVTGLGFVHGVYQSIHLQTEKFLKTELGGVFGEITYKAAEFAFMGGPVAWLSDIVWGDKTWTTAGYDKAKCEADCGNPKLSSIERKLCKIGARLDLKF